MNRRKQNPEIVPETEPNDDETQCDSPPSKKRLNEGEYRADEVSYNIFEPNSQNLDQYKDYEARDTLKTIEFTESSTQTYSNAEENIKKMEFANNAFGTFVGLELANVPVLKRRYVMYQIIKIIENNS